MLMATLKGLRSPVAITLLRPVRQLSSEPQPRWGWDRPRLRPQGSRVQQPWAVSRNPVGIAPKADVSATAVFAHFVGALVCASVANARFGFQIPARETIRLKAASRIASIGALWPVQSSNWRAACATSISRPPIRIQPSSRASVRKRVSMGL